MKKIILILLVACSCIVQAQVSVDGSLKLYNNLPTYKVLNTDSVLVAFPKLFATNKANVLLFFSPDCDHCEEELETITKANNSFKEVQFILVSNRPLFMLKPFIAKHQLPKYKNIKVISDNKNDIARYYSIGSYPSMVIYNNKKVTVKKFISSKVAVDDILKYAMLGQ